MAGRAESDGRAVLGGQGGALRTGGAQPGRLEEGGSRATSLPSPHDLRSPADGGFRSLPSFMTRYVPNTPPYTCFEPPSNPLISDLPQEEEMQAAVPDEEAEMAEDALMKSSHDILSAASLVLCS